MKLLKTKELADYSDRVYGEEYQRELTVDEYVLAKELHAEFAEMVKDFIGLEWTVQHLEEMVWTLRHMNSLLPMNAGLSAEQVFEDGYYDDYYCTDEGMDILCTLSKDTLTNTIRLSRFIDIEVKGLDYAYECVDVDKEIIELLETEEQVDKYYKLRAEVEQ